MDYPDRLPFWRANGELIPSNDQPLAKVVLSSVDKIWNDVLVKQCYVPVNEVSDVMHRRHTVVVALEHPVLCELKQQGRFRRFFNATGSIAFFPSCQPFSLRLNPEKGAFTDVLSLGLDPVFVSRVAEGMELDARRVELVGQQRNADPKLYHISMALRAGVLTGNALDRMYGEALATALAVHLLSEYSSAVLHPKSSNRGLPRATLLRAVQYIQDQLDADLTVSGIAQAVCISPYYFTRLFKESTGLSPYQYVVEARVKKARELLTTGKFSISEAAHHVGFVDQSHLTRHFKRVFGLPPKTLLSRRSHSANYELQW
jgi:AraC family transcriptional regulator